MKVVLPLLMFALVAMPVVGQENFEKDVVNTAGGDLWTHFIGHGSLML